MIENRAKKLIQRKLRKVKVIHTKKKMNITSIHKSNNKTDRVANIIFERVENEQLINKILIQKSNRGNIQVPKMCNCLIRLMHRDVNKKTIHIQLKSSSKKHAKKMLQISKQLKKLKNAQNKHNNKQTNFTKSRNQFLQMYRISRSKHKKRQNNPNNLLKHRNKFSRYNLIQNQLHGDSLAPRTKFELWHKRMPQRFQHHYHTQMKFLQKATVIQQLKTLITNKCKNLLNPGNIYNILEIIVSKLNLKRDYRILTLHHSKISI